MPNDNYRECNFILLQFTDSGCEIDHVLRAEIKLFITGAKHTQPWNVVLEETWVENRKFEFDFPV